MRKARCLAATVVTPGRACPEAPAYSVIALHPSSVDLAVGPDAGCLDPTDEVLLINLQGTPTRVGNVGVWETLRVKDVDGGTVDFTAAKTRFYGDIPGSDQGIGDGGQKVALPTQAAR